jgi:hypothetical protein
LRILVDFSLQNKDGDEGQSEGERMRETKRESGEKELRETDSDYG